MRRLDWRFLLPEAAHGAPFGHLVLLGASPGVVEDAVASRIAERISTAGDRPSSADALVALDGVANPPLECLSPGAAVYWETRRVASAKRALRRAGVRLSGDYWVVPSFEQARLFLPLDRPRAVHWYLSSMFRATTPRQRLLEPVLRLAAPMAMPTWGHRALTGVKGPARGTPLLADVSLHPILLALGDAGRRVVLLPFAPDSPRPVSVLKLSRVASLNPATQKEQQVLSALRAQLSPALRTSIPEPRGIFDWHGLSVGIESCAPGQLLSRTTQGWGVPLGRRIEALRLVAAWQTRLHRDAPIERAVWGDALIHEWVDAPLDGYAQRFGVSSAEQRLFGALRARAQALHGSALPLIWTHWGLRDQNIFRDGQRLVVVDWEGGSSGPAGFDLIYFVTSWHQAARGLRDHPAVLRGLQELYCAPVPSDAASAAARQTLHAYLADLGLDPRFLPLLLVGMWVFRALGQPADVPRSANRYADYLGVLAAHTERLFGPSTARAPNQ
jgi:Phosphotransferase enzyme family